MAANKQAIFQKAPSNGTPVTFIDSDNLLMSSAVEKMMSSAVVQNVVAHDFPNLKRTLLFCNGNLIKLR